MKTILKEIGDCRNENLINDLFGSISDFARIIEEKGNEFYYNSPYGKIKVIYNENLDIHGFFYL